MPSRWLNGAARRELEELRCHQSSSAGGLCSAIVEVVLPEASPPRERWLTREEAARLLWAAWRYREVQKGTPRIVGHASTSQGSFWLRSTRVRAQVRFAVRALGPTVGRGWIDLDSGVFYRRAAGARETKKRQPPVPLPPELLAHLRRWKRRGQRFCEGRRAWS
jgi:integrase